MKRIKFERGLMLNDALYNCSIDNIRDEYDVMYGKGLIVGVVSTLMAVTNCDFETAFASLREHLPADFDEDCIPESWTL